MAPTKRVQKHSNNNKCENSKCVTFNKKLHSSLKPTPLTPAANRKYTKDSYENIILHYLSRLAGLFRSAVPAKATITDQLKPILKIPSSPDKAYDIVSTAMDYGVANNIIQKIGSYFVLKNKPKERPVRSRRSTPGPGLKRCTVCKGTTAENHRCKRRRRSRRRGRRTRR